MNLIPNNDSLGMTSQEAAALYLSEGQTTDPGLASMLDYAKKQPELLVPKGVVGEQAYKPAQLVIDDPDELERKALRNKIGFDYEVTIKPTKAVVTALGTKLTTQCKLTDSDEDNAKALAKAVIRLKKKYDASN